MGDSLTEGYGINKEYRWSDLLSKDLDLEIINSGISGDTTAGMLARFKAMVIDHKPSHVIIMGGTNDLALNLSDEQILGNILAMTRYARQNAIESIIGIPTPFYPPQEDTSKSLFLGGDALRLRIETYQQKLKQFAREDERLFIEFSQGMCSDLMLADGLHPNEKGHKLMMETATEVLLSIVSD